MEGLIDLHKRMKAGNVSSPIIHALDNYVLQPPFYGGKFFSISQ
jgi:hypothetical protein